MPRIQPDYFQSIFQEASRQWEWLEANPFFAAPSQQLFRQVKSPKHVLSELLQNAEDAGANQVKAFVDGNLFCFEHNGRDFDKENLTSLCRFGYSNKRTLYTLGFRGMGFKSTFSLGSRVEIWTPTIAIAFEEKRFTELIWLEDAPAVSCTIIRINVYPNRLEGLKKNLAMWVENPASILFFRSISQLELQGQIITKQEEQTGPIPNSYWVSLKSNKTQQVLHTISLQEDFPHAAIEEIKSERDVTELNLPACSVEIIIGLAGIQCLYAVLPTQVELELPFSCNAPFLQDPARTGITSPVDSPTNQWLLKRIGQLLATAVQQWLENANLSLTDRARAYELLPKPVLEGANAANDTYTRVIVDEFYRQVEHQALLLTTTGCLSDSNNCLAAPPELLQVWMADELLELFSTCESTDKKQFVLASEVPPNARAQLEVWNWLHPLQVDAIAERLRQSNYPPLPSHPDGLRKLWAYLASCDLKKDRLFWNSLAIVPVDNCQRLLPAEKITVLGPLPTSLTRTDQSFIISHLNKIDSEWVKKIQAVSDSQQLELESEAQKEWQLAYELSRKLRLEQVGIEKVLEQVAPKIFNLTDPGLDGLLLAWIAAQADVKVSQTFKFLCCDDKWRSTSDQLLVGVDPNLKKLLPAQWLVQHLINEFEYEPSSQYDRKLWQQWTNSTKSQLQRLPMPKLVELRLDISDFEQLCRQRQSIPPTEYPLSRSKILISDYDFDQELWQQWEQLAITDSTVWLEVVRAIVCAWNRASAAWKNLSTIARVQQQGYKKPSSVNCNKFVAAWIDKLRKIPCLPSIDGHLYLPSELLQRTRDNASLLEVELFLRPDFDCPENAEFLKLLGVRTRPASAERILNRLRELAENTNTFQLKLLWLYNALDWLLKEESSWSTISKAIKKAFDEENLILATDGTWHTRSEIVQHNDDDFPGVVSILESIADLPLWNELDVCPTAKVEDAIAWLNKLPSEEKLTNFNKDRVQKILRHAPSLIWHECKCWLNLEGEWQLTETFRWYAVSDNMAHLFSEHRQIVADFSFLGEEQRQAFTNLPALERALELRITKLQMGSQQKQQQEWIVALARGLLQIQPTLTRENTSLTQAERLSKTYYQSVTSLEVTPYLQGEIVGDSYSPNVLWQDQNLYVLGSLVKHHQEVVAAIASQFHHPSLKTAISTCVERSSDWIKEYLQQHFKLASDFEIATSGEQVEEQYPQKLNDSVSQHNCAGTAKKMASKVIQTVSFDNTDLQSSAAHSFISAPTELPPERDFSEKDEDETEQDNKAKAPLAIPTSQHQLQQLSQDSNFKVGSAESRLVKPGPKFSLFPTSSDVEAGSTQVERLQIAQAGVDRVVIYEQQQGRFPKVMPHYNPGYDIESYNQHNQVERYIEVKSLSGDWSIDRSVELTRREFEEAWERAECYWLYIVERAERDDFFITVIPNPASLVRGFRLVRTDET